MAMCDFRSGFRRLSPRFGGLWVRWRMGSLWRFDRGDDERFSKDAPLVRTRRRQMQPVQRCWLQVALAKRRVGSGWEWNNPTTW